MNQSNHPAVHGGVQNYGPDPHDNKARDELKEIRQLILKSVNSQMVDLDTLAADVDAYTQSRVEEARRETLQNFNYSIIGIRDAEQIKRKLTERLGELARLKSKGTNP